MSTQPALWRGFVHEGEKLENRQFVAEMHQIAPNCVSNFKNFPRVIPPDPQSLGEGTPLPQTPSRHGASCLAEFVQFLIIL